MRAHQLAILCVGAVPLVLTGPTPAGYVGIQAVYGGGGTYGLVAIRIYAVFDNPGQDEMLAVIGTPEVPMTFYPGGFFQHIFGTDTAPSEALIELFPDLAFDTFGTIGVKSVGEPNGQPVDDTLFLPGWPGFVAGQDITNSGWYVPPGSPQADPFDLANSFAGTGRILIGQFTSMKLLESGTLLLQYRSNGVVEQREVRFTADYTRCVEISDCIDHPCFGTWVCAGPNTLCFAESYPSPDCNSNRVLDSCDIDFGTSSDLNVNGVPDECDCLGGCEDGDGVVGITDFLALLGVWGQTGVSCDIDGGGVGITDFLGLLQAWGPCP